MKFKVGDKVRVKEDSTYKKGMYAGAIGRVTHLDKPVAHPYEVAFDEVYHLSSDNFHAHELEAV